MEFKLERVETQLDAFSIYTAFRDKNSIFLDSALRDGKLGKFSFIGINPFLTFKSYGKKYWINEEEYVGDSFHALDELVNKYKINIDSNLPLVAGALGYFSYDIGREIETLPATAIEDVVIPHSYFVFYDNMIIVDHLNNETYISALGMLKDKEVALNEIREKIFNAKLIDKTELEPSTGNFVSNFTKDEYLQGVEKVKDYIRSGDVYIANLTQRFTCQCEKDGYNIYKNLRNINPAPFSAFMELDGFEIISSSPERFMLLEDGLLQTRPIKGTRPRGKTEEEDEANKLELLNSEKDKSELLMIVDLERNDLSKICKPHSVKVTELFDLEEYSTVFHLVSTIEGRVKDNVSAVKCMRECFPGGSITGAPKIRAMEIIEEIEGVRRGLYTGSIGYFDFRGNMDFNIVIRTILKKNNTAYLGVGGGITIESQNEDEYVETLDKAKALMRVL